MGMCDKGFRRKENKREVKTMVDYKKEYPDGIKRAFWELFVAPMVKKIKGNKCENCGSTKNVEIHHLDYKKEVSINTLKVLCKKCHKRVIKKKK